ncbi:MAG: hypothetical protein ABI613_11115, partial [Gemmatimonadota bacterium]
AGLQQPTLQGTLIDNILWGSVLIVCGLIGLYLLRKKAPAIPVYFVAYCGVLLLYPYKMTRFFMPVAPLLLLAVFVTLRAIAGRWGERLGIGLGALLSGSLLFIAAPLAVHTAIHSSKCDRAHAMTSSTCFAPDRLAFFSATRYANEHLPADAVVLTIKEAAFSYYTGRKVMHPDQAVQQGRKDVPGYLARRGVNYALITPFVGGAEIVQPLLPYCQHVEIVQDFGWRTILLKLHPDTTLEKNACATFTDMIASIKAEAADSTTEE